MEPRDVDVVCVGDPFLDLIFLGLDGLPVHGEEHLAKRLKIVPGGMANVAYALGRLGLDAVVCAPIGQDTAGRFLAELMADAGIPWVGRDGDVTPVTVALPANGDRALVSIMPAPTVDVDAFRRLSARAAVVDLPSVPLLPDAPRLYAVLGDPEVAALTGRLPASLDRIHALLLNDREAFGLTGRRDPSAAATDLAGRGTTVVVTRGAGGAVAVERGGRTIEVAAPLAEVIDPTGAGDLFAAAFVRADLAGCPLDDCLRQATTYASVSLERAADGLKGITLDDFTALSAI